MTDIGETAGQNPPEIVSNGHPEMREKCLGADADINTEK
jgi:hypothetical protein